MTLERELLVKSPTVEVDNWFGLGELGCQVRSGLEISSDPVGFLKHGTKIGAPIERVGRRVRIMSPLEGWCSLYSKQGYRILGVPEQTNEITEDSIDTLNIKDSISSAVKLPNYLKCVVIRGRNLSKINKNLFEGSSKSNPFVKLRVHGLQEQCTT